MSNLIDRDNTIVDDPDSLFSKLQSETQTPNETLDSAQGSPQEEPESHVPEKFRGKRLEDVVKSYEELEKQFGKQGQELGELRKITDEYIKRQLAGNPSEDTYQTQDDIDENDPTVSTVDKIIEKKLGPVLKELHETKKEKMTNKLKELHPDFVEIVTDNEFVEWVKASPIRTELYVQADKGYDPDAANELFSVWKERKGIKTQKAKPQVVDETALRNAAMETGTAGSEGGEKVYRRADIVNLMRTNPSRYQQLEPEIRKAYAEGRVR